MAGLTLAHSLQISATVKELFFFILARVYLVPGLTPFDLCQECSNPTRILCKTLRLRVSSAAQSNKRWYVVLAPSPHLQHWSDSALLIEWRNDFVKVM